MLRGDAGIVSLVLDRAGSPVNVVGHPRLEQLDALLGEVEEGVRAGAVRAVLLRIGPAQATLF